MKQGVAAVGGWWLTAYQRQVDVVTACVNASECTDVLGTSCGCTRNLVVNKEADPSHFWDLCEAMGQADCGIATPCDCPPARGFVCEAGHCQWDYVWE